MIDLAGFDAADTSVSASSASGLTTLTVTDSSGDGLSATLTLVGTYSTSNFVVGSDGHGGPGIFDPPATDSSGASMSIGGSGNDNFIFHTRRSAQRTVGPEWVSEKITSGYIGKTASQGACAGKRPGGFMHDQRGLMHDQNGREIELTILMPCLNEAETVGFCIDKALSYLQRSGVCGEVLIADNGSTDGSQAIAVDKGAEVVTTRDRGYGAALRAGIHAARGRYIIMGDADDSYDFARLDDFVVKLRQGYDLVIGNRFRGGISPGAMPAVHRYLGNPVLSLVGRLFFQVKIGDFHCGLRGCNRKRILDLHLHTTGMEFASEMITAASLRKYSITEVPTALKKDGRSRPSHLRTWRDGWRHLRFLLIFSPRWLFIYPGFTLMALGLLGAALLFRGEVEVATGVAIDIHTFLIASIAILIGLQSISFGVIARRFATINGFLPESKRYGRLLSWVSLERGLIIALAIGLAGLAGLFWTIYAWVSVDFGPIRYPLVLRVLVLSLTAIAASMQIALTSFFLSIMDLPVQRRQATEADASP